MELKPFPALTNSKIFNQNVQLNQNLEGIQIDSIAEINLPLFSSSFEHKKFSTPNKVDNCLSFIQSNHRHLHISYKRDSVLLLGFEI